MRVLGIDPGSLKTGWGAVERQGTKLKAIGAGVIASDAEAPFELRLLSIFEGLRDVLEETQPDCVAIEDIFYAKNVASALKLGHARGVALVAASSRGLLVHSYAPALVKRSIAGSGQASKEQVAHMIRILTGVSGIALDATDALALAITHLNAGPLIAAQARSNRAK